MTKVFLSHSSVDKKLVRQFATKLRADGLTVWMDESDLHAGMTLADHIGQGLTTADHIVVFASKAAGASFWVKKELQIAVQREIEERRDLIIVVKLDDVELPPFLAMKLYIGMGTPTLRRSAYARLLTALQRTGIESPSELVPRKFRAMTVSYSFEPINKRAVKVTREMTYFPVNLLPVPHDWRPGFVYSASELKSYEPPRMVFFKSGTAEAHWRTTPKLSFNEMRGTYDRVVQPRLTKHKELLRLPPYGRKPDAPIRLESTEVFRRTMPGEDTITAYYPIEGLTVHVNVPPDLPLAFTLGDHPELKESRAATGRKWTLKATLAHRQAIQLRWLPA